MKNFIIRVLIATAALTQVLAQKHKPKVAEVYEFAEQKMEVRGVPFPITVNNGSNREFKQFYK